MMHRRCLAASLLLLGSTACDCKESDAFGSFEPRAASTVGALSLVPFDVNRQDRVGPNDWASRYGKVPEIVVSPRAAGFDVALHSYVGADAAHPEAYVLRFDESGAGYTLAHAFAAPTLGRLLGFVTAADGSFYYATGTTDPNVSPTYPAEGAHRPHIVHVFHVDASGRRLFAVDLDMARVAFDPDAEPIIEPGVASSARLGLAGDQLALVHGVHTAYDANVMARHQKGVSTYLDAQTGAITDVSGIWCSHSFDERYLVDGTDLYEMHLGDAFPRAAVVSRVRAGTSSGPFTLYQPKGATGDNNTYTRLGDLVRVDAGPGAGSYLALVATEHGDVTANGVNGSRDLALVRTVTDFASGTSGAAVDTTFGTAVDVTSGSATVTNRLLFLTDYEASSGGTLHAERPKLLALGGGEFLVLFERWSTATTQTFDGTYAMRIDGAGTILSAAARVSDSHLPRGDDAFVLGGEGCWLTGDNQTGALTLHCVSSALAVSETGL